MCVGIAEEEKEKIDSITAEFFEYFTIDQLDKINTNLQKKDVNIKENINYVMVYFEKAFSEELS